MAEIRSDDGRPKGIRPLGSSVAFGGSARDALIREFAEELKVSVLVFGGPRVVENIVAPEGLVGHEVLFLFPGALPAARFDGQDRFVLHQERGTACMARRCELDGRGVPGGPDLFPTGLKA